MKDKPYDKLQKHLEIQAVSGIVRSTKETRAYIQELGT